ncbi:MAG: amino acid ABC transporter ATP-binding protein, partial [Acidimicrobiales bacterium]
MTRARSTRSNSMPDVGADAVPFGDDASRGPGDVDTTPQSDAAVRATDVHKSFGRLEVLKGVSFSVRRGEVVVLIGASGSGKTTFLRCINHLERIDRGEILVDGRPVGYRTDARGRLVEERAKVIARQRAEIGFVFQYFNLYPNKSALENITLGPRKVRNAPREEAEELGRRLLHRVGLDSKADVHPAQLSGGQKQRVA